MTMNIRAEVRGTLDRALDAGWNEDEWTDAVLRIFADFLFEQGDAQHKRGNWDTERAFDELAEDVAP